MAEQHPSTTEAPRPFVISDIDYLRDPARALEAMRSGVEVIVQPTNGCARMVLSSEFLFAVGIGDDE